MKIKSVVAVILTLAIILAMSMMVTGCSNQNKKTDPTTSTSETAAATQKSTDSTKAKGDDQSGTAADSNQNSGSAASDQIGVSKDDAVANVLAQLGDDAEIISVEEGKSTEGFPCYVVTVTPSSGADPVKYFSGYLFCYAENYLEEHPLEEADNASSAGISYSEAIKNVKLQAGDAAQILSAEEGTSPEGLPCWVVTVSPVTDTDEAKTVTYYSGYLFCYADQ